MNPLRANAKHKLHFFRYRPGLLEEQVNIPFCRVRTEERRNSCLKFQPVLDRRNFNCEVRAETRTAARQATASSSPYLDDRNFLFGLDRLRCSVSYTEKQRHYHHGYRRVHEHLTRFDEI